MIGVSSDIPGDAQQFHPNIGSSEPAEPSFARARRLRLTSVFKTTDTEALLNALPRILPVAINTRADGSQEIVFSK